MGAGDGAPIERRRLIEMLEFLRATNALVSVCRLSRRRLERRESAEALWRLKKEDAFVLLESELDGAVGADRERLQETTEDLREDVRQRNEFAQRKANDAARRDFIEEIVEKEHPKLEEVETCLRYLKEDPRLIGGFPGFQIRERLGKKKKELERNL
ncbi:MAG TPA: hypothetical protein ENH10_04240 [Bacteroidetes bacterium]|nr:hypothetical protein [Bacteroidota bacterium]HEX04354.1 hypothetical protein [Bacteroidota bacterium]